MRTIPVRIDEPSGVNRSSWPVTFGVPFPRGEAPSVRNVALSDEKGADIPLQVTKLGVWPDGSVKWGLLDFQADLKANRDRTLQVSFGDDVKRKDPETQLHVTKRGKGVEVVTGSLKFTVKPGRHLFLDKVWLDAKGKFGPASQIVEGGGGRRSFYDIVHGDGGRDVEDFSITGQDDPSKVRVRSVKIEEQGPMRVVIAVLGSYVHKGLPDSQATVRIHAYAGKSYVKVFHTFTYRGWPKQDFVKQLGVGVPVKLGRKRTVTVGGEKRGDVVAGDEVGLLQDSFLHYGVKVRDAGCSDKTAGEGGRSSGWIDVSDGRKGVAVVNRHMWQEYPQELTVDAKRGEITANFWPASMPPLDLRRYSDKMYRFLGETTAYRELGTLDVPERAQAMGLAKTHEALFYFHAGDVRTAEVDAVAKAFQMPSVIVASPEYYQETDVLDRFIVPSKGTCPTLEKRLTEIHDFFLNHIEISQWYGMIDWGDIQHVYASQFRTGRESDFKIREKWSYDEGRWAWTNTEGMPGLSYVLQFFRTGDRKYFDYAEIEAKHSQDVDIFQCGRYKGRGHTRHNVNHWGDGDIEDRISQPDSPRFCYYLTGNSRSRDVSELVVDGHYMKTETGNAGGPTFGAHIYGLLTRWEMTGNPKNEKKLLKVIDIWLDLQRPDGSFAGSVANTATEKPDRSSRFDDGTGEGDSGMFLHNFGAIHALIETYRITGYERIRKALIRHADHCVKVGPHSSTWHLRVLGFAALETGDKKYTDRIKQTLIGRSTDNGRKVHRPGLMGAHVPVSGPPTRTMKTPIVFFFANAIPYAMEALDREPS
jgi:hypothetical protein